MAHKQASQPFNKPSPIPTGKDWPALLVKEDDIKIYYRHVLETLGKQSGMLHVICRKAQNKIQDLAKLCQIVVDMIDNGQWVSLSAEEKG